MRKNVNEIIRKDADLVFIENIQAGAGYFLKFLSLDSKQDKAGIRESIDSVLKSRNYPFLITALVILYIDQAKYNTLCKLNSDDKIALKKLVMDSLLIAFFGRKDCSIKALHLKIQKFENNNLIYTYKDGVSYTESLENKKLLEVGEGGFGSVYRVENTKKSVIKLPKHFNGIKGLKREAEVMFELGRHPGIVSIEYFGRLPDSDCPYLGMSYYEKGDLDGYLSTLAVSGVMSKDAINFWILNLANGLLYIHEKGFIHRDLKNKNILISEENTLKIADFGLAIKTKDGGCTDSLLEGTPSYWPPEMIFSKSSGENPTVKIGFQFDVWSLGLIIWSILAGKSYDSCYAFADCGSMKKLLDKLNSLADKKTYPSPLNYSETTLMGQSEKTLLESLLSLEPEQRPTGKALSQVFQTYFSEVAYSDGVTHLDSDNSKSGEKSVLQDENKVSSSKELEFKNQINSELCSSIAPDYTPYKPPYEYINYDDKSFIIGGVGCAALTGFSMLAFAVFLVASPVVTPVMLATAAFVCATFAAASATFLVLGTVSSKGAQKEMIGMYKDVRYNLFDKPKSKEKPKQKIAAVEPNPFIKQVAA